MNPQAEKLNQKLGSILTLLSEKGKAIYFPKEGIVAQSAEAKGKAIDATIGTAIEDDGSPMRLESTAKNILLPANEVFPYAPSYGVKELRQLWREQIYLKNCSLKTEISLPVVSSALTHGLNIMGYLFVNKGDEIILNDKYWGNYKLIFEQGYGGVIKTYNTFKGNNFDLESFETALNANNTSNCNQELGHASQRKIVLLNFPNNPTGYSLNFEEGVEILERIKKCAQKGNKIVVICDDAYFGLFYESITYKESLFSLLADLNENVLAIKLDGATKEDYAWGLRVGFITYGGKNLKQENYSALEDKTAAVIRASISNVSNLSQNLILHTLKSADYKEEKEVKYKILQRRYLQVKNVLKDKKYTQYFSALPYNAGYFMCVQLKEGLDAERIRQTLLQKYDTGVIALPGMLRIAFSGVKEENILKLFENIYGACAEQSEVLKMNKITIVGAGNVGSQAGFYAALKGLGVELGDVSLYLLGAFIGAPGFVGALLGGEDLVSDNSSLKGNLSYTEVGGGIFIHNELKQFMNKLFFDLITDYLGEQMNEAEFSPLLTRQLNMTLYPAMFELGVNAYKDL